MTKKKDWKFIIIPNGNIIAESGRYSLIEVNKLNNNKEENIQVKKLSLFQKFINWLKRRWFNICQI